MTKYIFTILATSLLLWSCQGESTTQSDDNITELETAYDANPNGDNLDALLTAYAQDSSGQYAEKSAYLKLSNNRTKEGINDLKVLLRQDRKGDYAFGLANAYKEQQQNEIAFTAYQAYAKAFPDHEQAKTISMSINELPDLTTRMSNLFERAKSDSLRRMKPAIINDYIYSAEAVALIYPAADSAATHLRRAASFAQDYQRNLNQALVFYEMLIDNYPNTGERESALFATAFLYDEELGNLEKAQQFYEQFLKEYPNSDFADDAEIMLTNLGKDDEELLEELLKRREG
ncbi:MAG: tetratricopeptide repeat protein [Bacteroidota bacterium]